MNLIVRTPRVGLKCTGQLLLFSTLAPKFHMFSSRRKHCFQRLEPNPDSTTPFAESLASITVRNSETMPMCSAPMVTISQGRICENATSLKEALTPFAGSPVKLGIPYCTCFCRVVDNTIHETDAIKVPFPDARFAPNCRVAGIISAEVAVRTRPPVAVQVFAFLGQLFNLIWGQVFQFQIEPGRHRSRHVTSVLRGSPGTGENALVRTVHIRGKQGRDMNARRVSSGFLIGIVKVWHILVQLHVVGAIPCAVALPGGISRAPHM